MNLISAITRILALVATISCLLTLAQAGGDKSAKRTIITLTGGGDKSSGHPIPIPMPYCIGKSMGHHYGGMGGWGR